MKQLLTTDDVIRALGGPTALGRLVGRNPQAVNHWRSSMRGKFPAWTILLIQNALEAESKKAGERLIAPASLWGVEEPQQRRSA